MSYGSVYIESDIEKMKEDKYSKKYIVYIISRRIRYRYPEITKISANRIALDTYNGNSVSSGWLARERKSAKQLKISDKEFNLWRKLNLTGL